VIASASAVVPPNRLMMSDAVMSQLFAENGNFVKRGFAACVIDSSYSFGHSIPVLDTGELLALLEARGIKNREIARVLGINDSRVTEIKKGERQVKLDEAAKLVRHFGLEQAQLAPLPAPVARLMILHVAQALGKKLDPDSPEMRELSADIEAFARFVADPQVRESVEASENFFRAMQLRSGAGREAPLESRRQTVR
jgi:transcriptional regulator with XRE-family HTH domain